MKMKTAILLDANVMLCCKPAHRENDNHSLHHNTKQITGRQ